MVQDRPRGEDGVSLACGRDPLLELTNRVAFADDLGAGLAGAIELIGERFRVPVCVLLRNEAGELGGEPHPGSTFVPGDCDRRAAVSAWETREPAGRQTPRVPEASGWWAPIPGDDVTLGVLGLVAGGALGDEAMTWLGSACDQLGRAIRKAEAARRRRDAEIAAATERFRRILIDSVSHDLKSPLAALEAAIEGIGQSPGEAAVYVGESISALRRLSRNVDNLLEMTRLETGGLRPRHDWCDIPALVDAALDLTRDALEGHPVREGLAPSLPMVRLDETLLVGALVQILHNVGRHTPPGTEACLRAQVTGGVLEIDIIDRGPGFGDIDPERLFEKFFHGGGRSCGMGLGLTIARGLVRVQGGEVTAMPRPEGGAIFRVRLPAEERCLEGDGRGI